VHRHHASNGNLCVEQSGTQVFKFEPWRKAEAHVRTDPGLPVF